MRWRGRLGCPSHQPRRKKQEVCSSFIQSVSQSVSQSFLSHSLFFIHSFSQPVIHLFIHSLSGVERMPLSSAQKEEARSMLIIHSFSLSFIHRMEGKGCPSHQPSASHALHPLIFHSFICSFNHLFFLSWIHLFICSFIHSFIHSFISVNFCRQQFFQWHV